MVGQIDPLYENLYGGEDTEGLIPCDIGRPQPVVTQLMAAGAVRGAVLDPGTGPGYHAIHFAQHGLSATGIDGSPSALKRAQRNAEQAGVNVDFRLADATSLRGLENTFDTVVDSAFYHILPNEDAQTRYVQALHRATKAGARLYLFEFSQHNVNGVQWDGLPEENFHRVLPASGWRIDYLGTATYLARLDPDDLDTMAPACQSMPGWQQRAERLQSRLKTIAPLVIDNWWHMPIWAVAATRLD